MHYQLYIINYQLSALLSISGLRVAVDGKEVVRGIDLEIASGEVHAIMGPNGSGKSSLVSALAGHPKYEILAGTALYQGQDLLAMEPHLRAQAGLFLAFQYPKEIAGVSLRSFLFAAYKAQCSVRQPDAPKLSPIQFGKLLTEKMKLLHMDPALAERSVNQGFSGGERKKAEVLQMHVLQPLMALLDETDSGLDVDALRVVAEGVSQLRVTSDELTRNSKLKTHNSRFSALLVTHYARILEYVTPDHVHVMVRGRIVKSGGPDFARQLEAEGYAAYEGSGRIGLE